MSSKKPIVQAEYWGQDYPVVIVNAHLPLKDAVIMAEHDIGDIGCYYGSCISVKHCWAKYKFVGEGDNIDCDYDVECGKDAMWFIHESENRPAGVTRKITILVFDGVELNLPQFEGV